MEAYNLTIIVKTKNSLYRMTISDSGFTVEKMKSLNDKSDRIAIGNKFSGTNLILKKGERLVLSQGQKSILVTSPIIKIINK